MMETTNNNCLCSVQQRHFYGINHQDNMDVKEFLPHSVSGNTGHHRNNPSVMVGRSTPRVQFDGEADRLGSHDLRPLCSSVNDPTGSYRQHTYSAAEIGKATERPDSGLSCASSELDSGVDDLRSFTVTPTPLPGPLQPETDIDVIRRVNTESYHIFLDEGKDNGKEQEKEKDGDKSCHSNRSDLDVSLSSELYQSDDLTGMMNKSISPSPEREDYGHVTEQHIVEFANYVRPEAEAQMRVVPSVKNQVSRRESRGMSRDCDEITGKADGGKETNAGLVRSAMTVTPENYAGVSSSFSSPNAISDNDATSNSCLDLFQISNLSSASALKQNTNGKRSSYCCQLDSTIMEKTAKEHHNCDLPGMASALKVCSCSSLTDTLNDCLNQQTISALELRLENIATDSFSDDWHASETVHQRKALKRLSTESTGGDVSSDHVSRLTDKLEDHTPAAAQTSPKPLSYEDTQKAYTGSSAGTRRRGRKQKTTTKRPRDDSPHSAAIHPCRKLSVAASSMDDTFDANGYDVSPSVASVLDATKLTSVAVSVGVPDELVDNSYTSEWFGGDRLTGIYSTSLSSVWQPLYESQVHSLPTTTTSDCQLPVIEQLDSRTAPSACCDNSNTTCSPVLEAIIDKSEQEQHSPFGCRHVAKWRAADSDVLGQSDNFRCDGVLNRAMSLPSDRMWTPHWHSIGRHKSRGLGLLSISAPSVAVCRQMSHSEIGRASCRERVSVLV